MDSVLFCSLPPLHMQVGRPVKKKKKRIYPRTEEIGCACFCDFFGFSESSVGDTCAVRKVLLPGAVQKLNSN